jgi:hypothetical protein
MSISAMITDREDRRTLTETCPSATLFITHMEATIRLTSYGNFTAVK